MANKFVARRAVREKRSAKICLAGPAGSGKTMSALRVGTGLLRTGKLLLIDSEKSASLYADKVPFDVCELPDFDVDTYVDALEFGAHQEYEVVVVDSASQLWEQILSMSKKMPGNSFVNWGKLGDAYNRFVKAVVEYQPHLIITTRAKMKYEQVGSKVTPMGLDPVMRDGFEYEVDLYGMIDIDHNMTVRKTRMEDFADKIIYKPGEEFGRQVRDWLGSGKAEAPDENPGESVLTTKCSHQGKTLAAIHAEFPEYLAALISQFRSKVDRQDLLNIEAFLASVKTTEAASVSNEGEENGN